MLRRAHSSCQRRSSQSVSSREATAAGADAGSDATVSSWRMAILQLAGFGDPDNRDATPHGCAGRHKSALFFVPAPGASLRGERVRAAGVARALELRISVMAITAWGPPLPPV